MSNSKNTRRFVDLRGFSLIEILVGVAVFMVISTALYETYISVFSLSSASQYKILSLNLANEQIEIIRNLPYSDVGELTGIPKGKIPHTQEFVRGGVSFTVNTTIRNIDLPFDGTIGGSPNDLSPADNKMVEIEVTCSNCKNYNPITVTTNIAPKNLESASTNGSLFVKVFDANGVPVSGANVSIVNNKVSPSIAINDVTDINGLLAVVDAPPGIEAYEIIVSKNGYSTDRTYATSTSNPNPTKPNATVIVQQVTQVSFSIDRISTLNIKSVGPTCLPIPDYSFNMTGSKMKGDGIPKFSSNISTNSSGEYINSSMEWDTYSISGTDSAYEVIGINPLSPNVVDPNSTENIIIIAGSKSPKSLLVTVKDSSTGLPISDALVDVSDSGSYLESKITDRGYFVQTDWSGGNGQIDFVDSSKYYYDDGNLDVDSPSGELKLLNTSGSYASSTILESSIIDLGSVSNFHKLFWEPTDQPVNTGTSSVRIQFATNEELNASTTWNYKGPDGSSGTFYTTSNSIINPSHNGGRYARYKIYLSTDLDTDTPNISDVYFTYTSSCTPPGQVMFNGLSSGSYTINVGKSGYSTSTANINVSEDWQESTIILSP